MVRDTHLNSASMRDASDSHRRGGSERNDELEDESTKKDEETRRRKSRPPLRSGSRLAAPRDDAAPRGAAGRERGRRAPQWTPRRTAQTSDLPIISELLKQGQEILVQIAKEPIAKKGARITSHIALPGRFLVFMPTVNHVGVSRKISSDEERQRLKRILISEKGTRRAALSFAPRPTAPAKTICAPTFAS